MSGTALSAAESRHAFDLTAQLLDQSRTLSEAIAALDAKQKIHEAICRSRHERIDENLDTIKGLIREESGARIEALRPIESAMAALNGRAWAAMSWLTGSLGAACAGLIAIIATHLLK